MATTTSSYPASTIAKLFDISERRVRQLVQENILPKASRGNYELVSCIKGYIKYLKERSIGKDGLPSNIAIERGRLLKMQADRLSMEIDLEKGKLLYAKKAAAGWDNLITRCRSSLLGIPSKLAFQVTVVDPREAERLMKSAIYEALTELSICKNIGEPLNGDEDKNEQTIGEDQRNGPEDQELHTKDNA